MIPICQCIVHKTSSICFLKYYGLLFFFYSVLNLKGPGTLQLIGLQEIFIGLIILECTGSVTTPLTGPV